MCPLDDEETFPTVTPQTLQTLRSTLLNTSGTTSLAHRFRALFTLKALGKSTSASISLPEGENKNLSQQRVSDEAINIIAEGFKDESALLKHELAYVLGQMGNQRAVEVLESVLGDLGQDAMVRHEAAEALGALTSTSSEPLLRKFLDDPERCVRETCEIALARLEWTRSQREKEKIEETRQFTSIDPAPPLPRTSTPATTTLSDISALASTLTNSSLPLFDRYRAMFSLRNIAGQHYPTTEKAAVDALASGFVDDSELFKHEIAFVFGQLSTPYSIPALLGVLKNETESSMVRHEAAEALGGIVGEAPVDDSGSEPIDVLSILKEWSRRKDAPRVVRESCVVAVDMWEYENSNEFQYANGLEVTEVGG